MKKVISVRFKENGKSYYFDPGDAVIHTGEYVIVETAAAWSAARWCRACWSWRMPPYPRR